MNASPNAAEQTLCSTPLHFCPVSLLKHCGITVRFQILKRNVHLNHLTELYFSGVSKTFLTPDLSIIHIVILQMPTTDTVQEFQCCGKVWLWEENNLNYELQ